MQYHITITVFGHVVALRHSQRYFSHMRGKHMCRCKIEFWPHWISTRGVLIQRAAIKIQRIFHVELRPPETGGHCITTPPTDKILTPPLNCDPTQTVLSCCREFSFNLVPRSCLQFFDSFRRQMLCSNACSNTLKLTWRHICHRQIS